jgi:predicted N-acyltransferase
MRRGVQFHWFNRAYRDFDDFPRRLHRRQAQEAQARATRRGRIRPAPGSRHGDEIDAELWHAIHRQYRDTFARYGNHPAFPAEFFSRGRRPAGRRMVVFIAFRDRVPVASAICYRDADALRPPLGHVDRLPGLHFELCYYQGIDYCIRTA